MSRPPRKVSETGYYHVITRGIGRQILFEEPNDYRYYIRLLQKYSEDTGAAVCAYCLMENHVHLLIYDRAGALPLFVKKVGISYSAYFNRKYDRCGHLFQDRYKSETVDDDSYLLSVFRYILKNPQKAGVCSADEYEWSSYKLYGGRSSFVNTETLCDMLGNFEHYAEFISAEDNCVCMEYAPEKTDDDRAADIVKQVLGVESGTAIQSYPRAERNEALIKLLRAGMSIRQIERYTGISRGVIQELIW